MWWSIEWERHRSICSHFKDSLPTTERGNNVNDEYSFEKHFLRSHQPTYLSLSSLVLTFPLFTLIDVPLKTYHSNVLYFWQRECLNKIIFRFAWDWEQWRMEKRSDHSQPSLSVLEFHYRHERKIFIALMLSVDDVVFIPRGFEKQRQRNQDWGGENWQKWFLYSQLTSLTHEKFGGISKINLTIFREISSQSWMWQKSLLIFYGISDQCNVGNDSMKRFIKVWLVI